jgi:prevent-host-death family protein
MKKVVKSGSCNEFGGIMDTHVSIGQVKRDISELVNRVAFGGERIVLTSRNKPKAALVSMDDYQRLLTAEKAIQSKNTWLIDARKLADRIQERRDGFQIDVDDLLKQSRQDLDQRHE